MNRPDLDDALGSILREALHADAGHAPQLPVEWNGPTAFGVGDDEIEIQLVSLEYDDNGPRPQRRRPPRSLVAAAAVMAIVVTAIVLTVAQVTDESLPLSDRRDRETAALRIGFVGLPPTGARPSTPEQGVLVLAIYRCVTPAVWDGLTVMADGRLIWQVSRHMVEQRLTPEGVELMRSELLDSGLLDTGNDDDTVTTEPASGECEGYSGHINVDGHPYGSEFGGPIEDARLARLADPWSWLPASAWEDDEIKAFVPSEYSVLIHGASVWNVPYPSDPAPGLPTAVQELLPDEGWQCQSLPLPDGGYCYRGFTTDEVRTLAAGLDAAGFVAEINGGDLKYHDDETSVQVSARPRLPWEVCGCPIPG